MLCSLGEIFGGFQLASDCNDAEFLMQTLGKCCSCGSCLTGDCVKCGKSSVTDVLSTIKGPWAIIFWQVTPNGKFLCVQIYYSVSSFHMVSWVVVVLSSSFVG